jgi:thioredoxin-related protein
MLSHTFTNKNIIDYIKENFIMIDININDKGTISYKSFKGSKKEFARYMEVGVYPLNIFIDSNYKKLYTVNGYKNKEEFLPILKYIDTNSYKNKSLSTFTQELEFDSDE